MVKVCKCCSNIDVEQLMEVVDASEIEFGCIDHCGEHSDKVFGLVNEELVVEESQDAFFARIR